MDFPWLVKLTSVESGWPGIGPTCHLGSSVAVACDYPTPESVTLNIGPPENWNFVPSKFFTVEFLHFIFGWYMQFPNYL